MSRKAVAAALVAYLVVALAFGVVLELAVAAAAGRNDAIVPRDVLAAAISTYVISGLAPMLVWAFGRFRARNAAAPLLIWGVVGFAYMVVCAVGTLWDQKNELNRAPQNITTLSGSVHDTLVRTMRSGCVANQKRLASDGQGGTTDAQIENFCRCFADAMAKEVTAEEIVYTTRNGRPPPSFNAKADKISPACRRIALGR